MEMQTFDNLESEVRGYVRAYPTVFKSASNARQVDENDKSYIDFFAGAGVLNFGHNNSRMKKALVDFIESDGVAHSLDMATTAKRAFMERFNDTILKPRGMDYKIQFMGPTGTNSVETALKLARKVTGRSSIIAFSHGFHGMTLGSLAATANDYFRNAAGIPLEHVTRIPYEDAPGGGVETIEGYRKSFRDSSSGLEPPAAVLVETIQAEGGVHVGSKEFLQAVQKLARDTGALFIIDEIQVGCGRTGSYFSFDGLNLDPDIICLAKGIGGFGTPLAMNLNKPEHDKHWSPGEHTGTFRGQGFSFVAGREALSYFDDDDLMVDVRQKGKEIQARLEGLVDKYSNQGWEVRGRGMIQGLDVGDGAVAKKMQTDCFENGLLIGPCGTGGRVMKFIPPLTIPHDDLEEGMNIFETSVQSVMGAA